MNRSYPYIDGPTQEIASLADLPTQPVNMRPLSNGYLGKQIQQLKVDNQAPVVDSAAPLLITRRSVSGGQFQFRVQFIAPTKAQDPNYQGTTVLLSSPSGTVRLAAAAGAGPIIFNAPQSTAPGSAVVQQNNVNATSAIGNGNGNSRALNQL